MRIALTLLLLPALAFGEARDITDCTIPEGHTYSESTPFDLDWCTLVDGDDITALLVDIADEQGADVYIRAPAGIVSYVSDTIDWKDDPAVEIDTFVFLEDEWAGSRFTLEHADTPTDFLTLWTFENFDTVKIGSANLGITFVGNHPGLANCDSWPAPWGDDENCNGNQGLIEFRMSNNGTATLAQVFANIRYAQAYAIYTWGGNSLSSAANTITDFRVAGLMYATSGIFFHQGVANAWGDPDRLVVSDPYIRAWGWDGVERATMDRGLPMGCNHTTNDQNRGATFNGYFTTSITGGVTVEYGAMNWIQRYTGTVGTAAQPFVLRIKDWFVSGPNELGYPAGVRVKKTSQVMLFKGDPHEALLNGTTPTRYVRIIKLPDDYGSGAGSAGMSGAGCGAGASTSDDGPAEVAFLENNTILLNRGWHFEFSGDWRRYETYSAGKFARGRLFQFAYTGDTARVYLNTMRLAADVTLDTAQAADLVAMHDTSTITGPGTYGNVTVSDFSASTPGRDNTITDTNIAGTVAISAGVDDTVIDNVRFIGSARAVITVGASSDVTVTDLCVPDGSTITGTGTLTYEGASESLPFTIPDGTSNCLVTDDPKPGPVTGGSVN